MTKEKSNIKALVYFTPNQVDEIFLKDKNVVVIDVLRSSTTIVHALNNGARIIIPVPSIESAVKISGSAFGDVVLRCGERNGRMIEGFNLGNSPLEYKEEVVKGKTIIFYSTNGSPTITKSRYAKNLLVAGFVNITAVAEYLASLNEDFYIICAGNQNSFCIEDVACAGMLISKVENISGKKLEYNDASNAAYLLYKIHSRSILKLLRQSDHGKYLSEIGFREDLKVCAAVDSVPKIPTLIDNSLILKR
ncbi:MAG: putative 2-phosphosulfolactate phosphatase [Ignavibacteriae bacterium]|nr:MAG: putative 2-phosphosulfolactate phosphatase [Ignavibacteriota bacterium]